MLAYLPSQLILISDMSALLTEGGTSTWPHSECIVKERLPDAECGLGRSQPIKSHLTS